MFYEIKSLSILNFKWEPLKCKPTTELEKRLMNICLLLAWQRSAIIWRGKVICHFSGAPERAWSFNTGFYKKENVVMDSCRA